MAYEIEVRDEGVIHVSFTDESDYEENLRAREEVLKICREQRICKILKDWRQGGLARSLETIDIFQFGSSWSCQAIEYPVRLAVVIPEDHTAERDIRFFYTVAHNRGLCCELFDCVDTAVSWLNKGTF